MDGFPLSLQKVDEVCHIFVLLGFRIKIKEAHVNCNFQFFFFVRQIALVIFRPLESAARGERRSERRSVRTSASASGAHFFTDERERRSKN